MHTSTNTLAAEPYSRYGTPVTVSQRQFIHKTCNYSTTLQVTYRDVLQNEEVGTPHIPLPSTSVNI